MTSHSDQKGFVAHIGPRVDAPRPKWIFNLKLPRDRKVAALVTAILALGAGTSSYLIVGWVEPKVVPMTIEDVTSFNVTKELAISNQWGITFHQSYLGVTHGGALSASHVRGGIVVSPWMTTTEVYFMRDWLIAFNYTGMSPPATFMDARLTIPLAYYRSSAYGGVWGDGYTTNLSRDVPVSIYEVKGPWKTWTGNLSQRDGATWAMVKENRLVVDRNPVATVYLNSSSMNITFDVKKAVSDWKNGTWYPQWGFMISMIAPWESTSSAWFSVAGYNVVTFQALENWLNGTNKTSFQIGRTVVIPEFGSFGPGMLSIVVMCTLVALLSQRRRGRSAGK